MNQTLTAVLALMTATFLSINIQQNALRSLLNSITSEYETIGGAVALDILDYVGYQEFDDVTRTTAVTDESQLTPLPFDTTQTFASADDIDDFHGVTDHIYTTPYDPTEYLVDISVTYVHEDNPDSTLTTQSFAKKVTVTVTHPQLNSNVTMSQVFSYP
ncbi:MAG: hypothetical protein RhofKO_11380 [Rhodothermales bacterium]